MQVQKTTIAFTITVCNQIFAKNSLAKRSVCHFLGQTNWKPETAPIFSSRGPRTRLSKLRIWGRADDSPSCLELAVANGASAPALALIGRCVDHACLVTHGASSIGI